MSDTKERVNEGCACPLSDCPIHPSGACGITEPYLTHIVLDDGETNSILWLCPNCDSEIRKALTGWTAVPRNGERQRRKTHCRKGHEFTPINTRMRNGKYGPVRHCRECGRISNQKFKLSRKNKVHDGRYSD